MGLMGGMASKGYKGDRRSGAGGLTVARFGAAAAAITLALLAGCDTISDAATGTGQAVQGAGDWVGGLFTADSGSSDQSKPEIPPAPAEQPKLGNDERPTPPSATERQQLADSLVADNANAQYTEAEQKRMGDTTRPLTPENAETPAAPAAAAPAPAPATTAAAPTPAPAPATPVKKLASASDLPAPTTTEAPPPPPPAQATASGGPTAAPAPAPAPAQVAMAAPAPSAAPAPRRVVASGGDLVADTYRERLAEFSAAPAASATYAAPPAASYGGTTGGAQAPASGKLTPAQGSGGARPLSALDRSKMAASFQLAEIVFGEGTAALSAADDAPLRAVADVYRDSKGAAKIGIIGHSNSPRLDVSAVANRESNRSLAAERASAVARALERLGVPANKIFAGATGEGEGDYAEVFVAY